MTTTMTPRRIGEAAACHYLGVSRARLAEYRKNGLKFATPGRKKILYDIADLDAVIENEKRFTAPATSATGAK